MAEIWSTFRHGAAECKVALPRSQGAGAGNLQTVAKRLLNWLWVTVSFGRGLTSGRHGPGFRVAAPGVNVRLMPISLSNRDFSPVGV